MPLASWMRYKVIYDDEDGEPYYETSLFHPVPPAERITWGEPAQICQTRYDHECPRCSLSLEDGYDMATDSAGSCYGARCPVCEWTF